MVTVEKRGQELVVVDCRTVECRAEHVDDRAWLVLRVEEMTEPVAVERSSTYDS